MHMPLATHIHCSDTAPAYPGDHPNLTSGRSKPKSLHNSQHPHDPLIVMLHIRNSVHALQGSLRTMWMDHPCTRHTSISGLYIRFRDSTASYGNILRASLWSCCITSWADVGCRTKRIPWIHNMDGRCVARVLEIPYRRT